MTSMLEKACAAVYALAPIGVRSWEDCPVAEAEAIRAGVRAVLGAIRELDDASAEVHDSDQLAWPDPKRENIRNIWSQVIDAILAGEESRK